MNLKRSRERKQQERCILVSPSERERERYYINARSSPSNVGDCDVQERERFYIMQCPSR
jgi:hypothetical protein